MKIRESNLTRSPSSSLEDDHALKVLSESGIYRDYACLFRGHRPAAELSRAQYAERHPACAEAGKSLLCLDGQNERHVLEDYYLQRQIDHRGL